MKHGDSHLETDSMAFGLQLNGEISAGAKKRLTFLADVLLPRKQNVSRLLKTLLRYRPSPIGLTD